MKHFCHFLILFSITPFLGFTQLRCSKHDPQAEAQKQASRRLEQLTLAGNSLTEGKPLEAIAILESLNQENPNDADILEQLAFAYSGQNEYDEAALYFERAAQLSAEPHLRLYAAQAFLQTGNLSAARTHYEAYLSDNPGEALAWKELGAILRQEGQDEAALNALLNALKYAERSPSGAEALEIAQLYSALGNTPQAEAWYQAALDQHDESTNAALFGLLNIHAQREDWEDAQKAYRQLEDAHSPLLLSDSGKSIKASLNAWEQEQAELKRIQQEQEATQKKQAQEQAEALRLAELERNPPPPTADTLAEKAKASYNAGNTEEAALLLWRSLGMDDAHPDRWNDLSGYYLELNRPEEAETTVLEAIRRNPKELTYTLRYLKAVEQNRSPQYLAKELERAQQRFPQSPQITLALAHTYEHALGNPRNARFLYEEYLSLAAPDHPNRAEAQEALNRLN
jgi:tetratricopeptide (TPR) repeat protein